MDDARWDAFHRKRDAVAAEIERFKSTWINPRMLDDETAKRVFGKPLEREYSLHDLLKRPEVDYAILTTLQSVDGSVPGGPALEDPVAAEQVEIQIKYAGYVAKQQEEIKRQASQESEPIPADIDYDGITSLSIEVRQRLKASRPETIGQAARVSGVTPAAVSLLLIHIKRMQLRKRAA